MYSIWLKLLLMLFFNFIFFCGKINGEEIISAVEGVIREVKPDQSILIQVKKTRYVEINLVSIKTVAVIDGKNLHRGVTRTIIISGLGGAMGGSVGIINMPDGIVRSNNKVGSSIIAGAMVAGLGAIAKYSYNIMTRKSAAVIYNRNLRNPRDQAILNNLPAGLSVRITYVNYINSTF